MINFKDHGDLIYEFAKDRLDLQDTHLLPGYTAIFEEISGALAECGNEIKAPLGRLAEILEVDHDRDAVLQEFENDCEYTKTVNGISMKIRIELTRKVPKPSSGSTPNPPVANETTRLDPVNKSEPSRPAASGLSKRPHPHTSDSEDEDPTVRRPQSPKRPRTSQASKDTQVRL